MTEFSGMFHEDISGPDTSPDLWMADTSLASYAPDNYSTMYDIDVGLGYHSDFNAMSPSIGSSSTSSPASDCFELQPAAHAQEHVYGLSASPPQWFGSGEEGQLDALGFVSVERLSPQILMEQPPLRTVCMSDVVIPNGLSPSFMPPQPSPQVDHLPSMPSPIRAPRRQRKGNRLFEEDSDPESEEDMYCPSDASDSPARRSVGPASPLFHALPSPSRRRRRQDVSLPTPVPNLTKKSRGRKVPVSSGEPVYARSKDKSKKGTRTYTCHVNGCSKCFVRSEHLKRHIRSIHTNDKPWVCPIGGCEREFSRRDNLNQHMRIHKSP